MKTDAEVQRMVNARATGKTQEQVAARTGMSVRTVRTYERTGTLPSQLKRPRTYQTRPNPFADAWAWITAELARDPALQATTLFALLCERHPGRYQAIQLRTLQRHVAAWRVQYGPEQEVFFPQVHQPGMVAQSDFTHMTDLGIALGGVSFPHLLFHLVLTYSNVEAVHICPSESFEATRSAHRGRAPPSGFRGSDRLPSGADALRLASARMLMFSIDELIISSFRVTQLCARSGVGAKYSIEDGAPRWHPHHTQRDRLERARRG